MAITKTVDDSLFYCDIDRTTQTERFIEQLRQYSFTQSKQVYILKKPLGLKKSYSYNLTDIALVLIPQHSILILNYGVEEDAAFADYELDFTEDLGYLSDKYDYSKILGRPRKWPKKLIIKANLSTIDIAGYLQSEIDLQDQRKIDLLISLLIGSINNIDNVGINDPITLLDKVKQKIVLFDGKQSQFIYQHPTKESITIQGMAGTGKTELLLHKLKDVYSNNEDTIIAFTCFNKVLANDMKARIPRFFTFMKVEEQIDWEKRLHVFSSWGSYGQPESGMYSYICNKYKLPFSTYSENNNFDSLCKSALQKLEEKEDFLPCFDYILIDESQDFSENFFRLCIKICRKTVYIAGDIFQNIFDSNVNTEVNPDYLLNKCYRTDPKTLMFAHAVGMGLYENPPINWLEDAGWESCGYSYSRNDGLFTLSRSPLRRFEDLNATNTIRLSSCAAKNYCSKITECIENIRKENENVQADDIAIIVLGNYKKTCEIADVVEYELYDKYRWKSSKGYLTKTKDKDRVYISNINNIKGLEFPFIICVVHGYISDNIKYRNSIYMALTRSFLTSYFIVSDINEMFISIYEKAVIDITRHGDMKLIEPSDKEKKAMERKIRISLSSRKKPLPELLEELFNEEYPEFNRKKREFVIDTIAKISPRPSEEEFLKKARAFIKEVLGDR